MVPLPTAFALAAPPASTTAAVTAAAAVVAGLAAATAVRRVRGSTAVPAAWWAVTATVALALEAAWRGSGRLADPASHAQVRLVAAALSACPVVSLLGAKRPQHGVWQLIVASLAVVFALPAATAVLARPGSTPDLHPLGRFLLVLAVAAGWLNFVGTARGWPATLVTIGHALLARPFFPAVDTAAALAGNLPDAVGAVLVATGAVLASLTRATEVGGTTAASADRITGPFIALRETLGAAWTLRIMERFNAVAETRGWPCRLGFRGLDAGAPAADCPHPAAAADSADSGWRRDAARGFRSLARRFVTDEWLARHGWREDAP